jgi:hypothetical protein
MARKFLTPIDLSQLELQNAKIQNLSTTQINAISSPVAGQFVFDTTLTILKVYSGTAWTPVGSTTTGSGAPATTPTSTGALYFDTTNNLLYVSNGTSSSANWVTSEPRGGSGDIANLGGANSGGSSLKVANADHVHRHTGTDHASIKLSDLGGANGADISLNSYKITNLATPVSGTDAANKNYVDAAAAGIDWKASVRAATVGSSITLSNTQTLDGVSLVAGDRVLVKDQTPGGSDSTNGIYVVVSGGAWTRATDFSTTATKVANTAVFVEEGTLNKDTGWTLVTNEPITVGTTAIAFTQFTGLGEVTVSGGLVKNVNDLSVGTASTSRIVVNSTNIDLATVSQTNTTASGLGLVNSVTIDSYGRTTGQATSTLDSTYFQNSTGTLTIKSGSITNSLLTNSSISINAGTNISVSTSPISLGGSTTIGITGQIAVANGGTGASTAASARANLSSTSNSLPQKYTATNPSLTPTSGSVSWVVNHALGSQPVVVQVYDSTALTSVEVDVSRTDANNVTLSWVSSSSVSAGAYTVVVIG